MRCHAECIHLDLAQQFMINTTDTSDVLHPSLPPSLPKAPSIISPHGAPSPLPDRLNGQRSPFTASATSLPSVPLTPRSRLSESLLSSSQSRIDEVHERSTPFNWNMLQDTTVQDWTPPESWGVANHAETEALEETIAPIEVSTQHNVEESAASRAAFTTGDMVIPFVFENVSSTARLSKTI